MLVPLADLRLGNDACARRSSFCNARLVAASQKVVSGEVDFEERHPVSLPPWSWVVILDLGMIRV